MHCAKMAKSKQVPIGVWTQHYVRGERPDLPGDRVILGHQPAHCEVYGQYGIISAQTDE